MMLSRRRFVTICAAFAATPAAATVRWQGVALGAEVSVTLEGPRAEAEAAVAEVVALVREVEAVFSLYAPGSALCRLNRDGKLSPVPQMMREVIAATNEVHAASGGLFDPTVQALWEGIAAGRDRRGDLGWERVRLEGGALTLDPGQALTFNGIAQGYATDLAADALERRGFGRALIDMGEHRGLGGPWHLELADPDLGPLGMRTLTDGAIATSSPPALRLPDGRMHILNPRDDTPPLWSTVSVEARSATIADAVSTAACLMPVAAIRNAIRTLPGITRVTLVSPAGRLLTLS